MGPPQWVPSWDTWRYLRASVISEYLVTIPKKAANHIQKTAPGPPVKMAPVTPAMLPVPTVPARAVVTAWNGDKLFPWSLSDFLKREPTVFFMI